MTAIFNCPVEASLRIIGGKYKAIILWHLMSGTLRYSELRHLLPQATPKMLTRPTVAMRLVSDDEAANPTRPGRFTPITIRL